MTKEEILTLLEQVWKNVTNDILSKDDPILGHLIIVPHHKESVFKTTVTIFAQTQVGDPSSVKTIQNIAYFKNGVIDTLNQKPHVTKNQIDDKEKLFQSFCDKNTINDLLEHKFVEQTEEGAYRLNYSRLAEEFGFADEFQNNIGYETSLKTVFEPTEFFNTYRNPGCSTYYRRAEIMDFYTMEELQGLAAGR